MITQPTSTLKTVQDLYDRGLYLQAFEAAKPLGPLVEWRDVDACVLAGRLAANLGGARLARVLHRLAWRRSPEHSEARYFYVLSILDRRGLLEAWRRLKRLGPPPSPSPNQSSSPSPGRVADWWSLQATLLGMFRDFSRAEEAMQKALELAPDRAWIWVQRCGLFQMMDRHDESLESAKQALDLCPWYRPAVQALAYCLIQADQIDEALELLSAATERIESGDVLAQLAMLQYELELYEASRANWERIEDYYPLLKYDKERTNWLMARRSDAAFYCGDYEAAASWGQRSKQPFHESIAKRLRDQNLRHASSAMHDGPPVPRRVMLPVGFVRQHHLTCAPATLSALSAFWKKPADHLELAEQICYDGTPAHSERKWAEEQGFVAREFRVTWESAQSLLDAGVPFTLTTVDPGSAHLQAVIGYDHLRGTLLVRDPSARIHGEFRGEAMIEHYKSTGPRGMAVADNPQILDSINLPETREYDKCYAIQLHLERHDRDGAVAIYEQMAQEAPNHRLTHFAARAIAAYDGNPLDALKSIYALVEQYPDDVNLTMAKLSCLQQIGPREERLKLLQEQIGRKESDPLFLLQHAENVFEDHRELARAHQLARKFIRQRPGDAHGYRLLADILWTDRRREEALELYRFAACINDKDEGLAHTFFAASRHMNCTDEALALLSQRVERDGGKSSCPARTLCWALEQLEQPDKAKQVLEAALQAHPDDGQLLLSASQYFMTYGDRSRGKQLLEQARAKSNPSGWLRAAATTAWMESDLPKSLERWREVLQFEPFAEDAHRAVADLLASSQDEAAAAARAHIQQAVDRFPHNYTLRALRIEWASQEDPTDAEMAVRNLLSAHPQDPWAQRELAIALIRQSKWDEALVEARLAEELEPTSPVAPMILGKILQAQGNTESAKLEYQRSIRLSVDYDEAMEALVRACDTKQERLKALKFIGDELARQVNFGDGLIRFGHLASLSLEEGPLLAILRRAHQERPDLWQSWSILIRQLLYFERNEEALKIAETAVERFPLTPRLWLDLASVHRALNNETAEADAVRHALQITPDWSDAQRWLAQLQWKQGNLEEATQAMHRALRKHPLDVLCLTMLAEIQWDNNQREKAIEGLKKVVRIEPGCERAWALLRQWAAELDQREMVVDAARQVTRQRPQEARSFLILADVLDQPEESQQRLDALDEALKRNPRCDDAHSLKAFYLAQADRFEEAVEACHPTVYDGKPPLQLRSRLAQIAAMRGDLEGAIEVMHRVLEDDPDYPWAWTHLADWCEELGRDEEYLAAAQGLVRSAPHDPVSYGYRANAQMLLSNVEEAQNDLRRSLELDESYFYGASMLVDSYLEDGEIDTAADVVEKVRCSLSPIMAAAFDVRLASARGEQQRAAEHFRQVLSASPLDSAALSVATRSAQENPVSLHLADEIRDYVRSSELDANDSADLAEVWMRWLSATKDLKKVEAELSSMEGYPDFWARGVEGFLNACLSDGDKSKHRVVGFLRRNKVPLRSNLEAWAAAGKALADVGLSRKAVKWLADWSQREGVTAKMLFPAANSLRDVGRHRQARRLNETALTLPEDPWTPFHRLWIVADAIDQGDSKAAHDHWRLLSGQRWGGYYGELAAMVEFTLDCWLNPQCGSKSLQGIFKQIKGCYETFKDDALLQHFDNGFCIRLAIARRRRLLAAYLGMRRRLKQLRLA